MNYWYVTTMWTNLKNMVSGRVRRKRPYSVVSFIWSFNRQTVVLIIEIIGNMVILTTLIFPILEHGIAFHLFLSSSNSSNKHWFCILEKKKRNQISEWSWSGEWRSTVWGLKGWWECVFPWECDYTRMTFVRTYWKCTFKIHAFYCK